MNGNKAMDEMKEEELSSLNAAISKLACQYLLFEKDTDGKVACRVARFHIGNGALVHRVNFNADQSRKGVKESFTMMVNYKYDMTKISENQAGSEMDNHIPASPEILHFLKD
jgi:malonyl-CoA decarboxylase